MSDRRPTFSNPADVAVGDRGPVRVVSDLTRTDFVRYAGASGDFNPLHHDVPRARAAGYPDVFAQGMLTAGFGASAVADWFGLANVTYYGVRFQSRVYPGETIRIGGEITAVGPGDDGVAVEVDVLAETADGAVVLSGSAAADVPR
jgi:acyl dehydratase